MEQTDCVLHHLFLTQKGQKIKIKEQKGKSVLLIAIWSKQIAFCITFS